MEISTGGLTTGQWYYRTHRKQNIEAVKRYQDTHREERGAWNRRYYFKNRKSKMLYKARVYVTKGKRAKWAHIKMKDFHPFRYIDGERFERNMRDCHLYYQLMTGKIALPTYKAIMRSNYDYPNKRHGLTDKPRAGTARYFEAMANKNEAMK